MDEVWEIMSRHLYLLHHAYEFRIHAFVLMSNHFHLLASTPLYNLSDGMAYFMKSTSRDLTLAGNRINLTYGNRHFRSQIPSYHYYMNSYKYIYRNPIAAGLSDAVEKYPYSTLPGLLGLRRLHIPLEKDTLLFDDVEDTLKWLNTPSPKEDWEAVGFALRKSVFKLAQDPKTRRPSHLERDLL